MDATRIGLDEIARAAGGQVVGNGRRRVARVAEPEEAADDALCVVWMAEYLERVPPEAALLAGIGLVPAGRDGVEVKDPRTALAAVLPLFAPRRDAAPGVHPSAVVDPTAVVDASAAIGPLCVVGPGAKIGARVELEGHVFVGAHVAVGEGSKIEANVALRDRTVIGRRTIVHSGSALGCDGFGFVPGRAGHTKIPQIGHVVVGDDVEIGALCTIDRATFGATTIGDGTKIDDHVHIGHNCRVGKNCLIVAFTGLAGSTVLGDGATMASRTGTVPHCRIGKGAVVGGMAGVTTDVEDGVFVSGFPAQEHRKELKQQALLRRLPELFDRVKKLER